MNSVRKTGLILLLVFLLPAIFYSAYEISSLNRNEAVIDNIYQNQLDAILFSVNQYSDDITNNWVSKIESALADYNTSEDTLPADLTQILEVNPSIAMIFIADTTLSASPGLFTLTDSLREPHIAANINASLVRERAKVKRLVEYKKGGFRKVAPIETSIPDLITLVFILEKPIGTAFIGGISIDPSVFITETLRPKFQSIAKNQFILSAYKSGHDEPLYTTADTTLEKQYQARAVTKDFWILPDYYLGIDLKGKSIGEVVKERTYTNLALILLLDTVLILAIFLVFRNVRKEIQLAQNKSDFVSNVSHEIRTPLALISMFAETLEMGRVTTPEKRQEYYSIISKETGRLIAIVNKILSFSQVEANKSNFTFETIDLNAAVNEVLDTYEYHLNSKGFQYTFHPGEQAFISADKEALLAVIVNIIDNAIKYSAKEKLLEITTGTLGEQAFLRIADRGIGISPKDLKYIFDKFYRVSPGNLAKSQGTGLGLALVKHIVESHHGRIEVASELEKGTSFTIHFPLKNT